MSKIPIQIIEVDINLNNPLDSNYTIIKEKLYDIVFGVRKFTTTYDNAIIDVYFDANTSNIGEYEIAYEIAAIDPNIKPFTVDWDTEIIFKLVVAGIHYLNRNDVSIRFFYNTPSQTKHNAYQYYAGLWGTMIENRSEITEP